MRISTIDPCLQDILGKKGKMNWKQSRKTKLKSYSSMVRILEDCTGVRLRHKLWSQKCVSSAFTFPSVSEQTGSFIHPGNHPCCLRAKPPQTCAHEILQNSKFMVRCSVFTFFTSPGTAHLPATWRQCTKYVLQPVCGPLLHLLLLVHQLAAEKSKVITHKAECNRMLKTM